MLGLQPQIGSHINSRLFVIPAILSVGAVVCLGLALMLRARLVAAGILSLGCWVALGLVAVSVAERPLPADHVLRQIAAGNEEGTTYRAPTLELSAPLRWHGRLRSEPARLPWGYGIEIDLSGVDAAEQFIPVSGGLRLGFTPKEGEAGLPEVHAGDEVTVIAQARLPQVYRDAGAFDRREFLAEQNIHLLATLRASSLLTKTGTGAPTIASRLARVRGRLRDRLDEMFAGSPQAAAVLRAMLLGDRSFIERNESVNYQKTRVFHVLVVAGLHVGALAFFLFWLGRRLRLPQGAAMVAILVVLSGYIAVVEQRPPVLRAGLMKAIVVIGSFFYRRTEVLNFAALAALILLIAKPQAAADGSFQLSFLAIGCIAGVALPWIGRHVQPYAKELRGWRDVTRDGGNDPVRAQFRLDVRAACATLTSWLPERAGRWSADAGVKCFGWTLRGAEMFVLSLVLQIGMLPLMARDFHRIVLMGPLVNLLVVPLTGVIVPLGFIGLGTSLVVRELGRIVAVPLAWLVGLQDMIVGAFARMTLGSYRIPSPPVWVVALFFVSSVLLAASLRMTAACRKWVSRAAIVGIVCAAILIATYPFRPSTVAGALEMTVLDVGQGDAILVVSPRGSTLLIDGGGAFNGFTGREEHLGPDPGEDVVSPYLWSRGFKKLDAVALTHAHQDHIGGLTAVLQNFHVGRLWVGRESAVLAFGRLKEVAGRLHVPIEHELRGQSFEWDGVTVDFLWPEIRPEEVAPTAKNNDSLVVRLRYGERSLLLPGDAEKEVEYAMMSENDVGMLHADVLKIGHHGSKNSSMPEFLAALGARVGIISAGEQNPYGHPSPVLLERLKESGMRVLRTDRDGAVRVLTDGKEIRVSCYLECGE